MYCRCIVDVGIRTYASTTTVALLTNMKELGKTAQRVIVVIGHVLRTTFPFSSILVTVSLVIPNSRGYR